MNLTSTSASVLTLFLLFGTACSLTTHSAVNDPPPPPKPVATPTPAAQPSPSAAVPADELILRTKPIEAIRQVTNGEAILVDVRDAASYDYMHIKTAVNITFQDIMAGKIGNLPKDKHLIFYCTCPREHSAAQSAVVYQEKGYQKVSALQDGLYGYQAAGGNIEMKK